MTYQLRISEIFYSLQGESTLVGLPTVFIRLTGCPLRCSYCDTTYAFKGGETLSRDQLFEKLSEYNCRTVCVTGGEPLAQKDCQLLLNDLIEQGYRVSLETSGAIDVCNVNESVIKVVDLKTPASGEQSRNLMSNLACLNSHDQVKFVICNQQDYEWAKGQLLDNKLSDTCEVLFSPVEQDMPAAQLADWILKDQLNVRMQVQLHKILWGGGEGR